MQGGLQIRHQQHRIAKEILPTFKDCRLHEITPERVQQWISKMQVDGIARSARKVSHSILRSIFEVAGDWGYHNGRNPCKRVKPGPGEPGRDLRALEPGEIARLFAVIGDDEPLRTMVELAYYCGLRSCEILGLTWGDIDFRNATLRVRQGRSQQEELAEPKSAAGKRGDIDLGATVERFSKPEGARDTDLIWRDADYFCLQKRLKAAGKVAGIGFTGFGFHSLRRSHCTFSAIDVSPGLVRRMGHSSESMTKHYVRRSGTTVENLRNLLISSGDSRENDTMMKINGLSNHQIVDDTMPVFSQLTIPP